MKFVFFGSKALVRASRGVGKALLLLSVPALVWPLVPVQPADFVQKHRSAHSRHHLRSERGRQVNDVHETGPKRWVASLVPRQVHEGAADSSRKAHYF